MDKGLKAMIVEDEEVAAELLEIMLNRLGISDIVSVSNGMDAVETFKTAIRCDSPYSLVFLDIMMPEMDGQEILKRMRSAESQAGLSSGDLAKIIMTTALTSANSMVEAIFDGDCNDYLVKPVTHEYLREILQRNGVI
jgi:two-component system chemotaxis response regulator CheY